ncbi:FAD:protein FMN transferase [Parashewanella curva]|uniref:FAD:protein FMN transferase n=1 Tax=Parashewanella curva TaxID=2338552 RepID=A0A3L8PS07_9GAMM|nr:FAD:protein FMN transferase [Parashewanella curva]RLV58175.1 FAD:protein FMN transferase [Parashewanella curva]
MNGLLKHKYWFLLVSLFSLLALSGCSKPVGEQALAGNTMGTTYHIKYVPNDNTPDTKTLQAEIDKALELVNDQMSTYRPQSELSRFNKLKKGESITVSADLVKVLKASKLLQKQSHGSLDITVGPLVNLWGFGPDKPKVEPPLQADINTAKAKVNINAIEINGLTLTKGSNDLYADLSTIAKGFGVDKVSSIMDKYHISGYLVEIGGELKVKGKKADGSAWRIAVEKPVSDKRAVQEVIQPGSMAMATSGDYRNYFEENGKRYTHIIDPNTGYPVQHKLVSATVLHPSCMMADGYSTAMMVLGTKRALELAKKENLAIMLIEKHKDGFKVIYSDAFKPYVPSSK